MRESGRDRGETAPGAGRGRRPAVPLALLLLSTALGAAHGPQDDAPEPAPAAPPEVVSPAERPNLVVLISDDQRFDSLSCTGSLLLETPSFDRLAREGVVFDNAHVITSLCCPSRASILTGCYTHRHGVTTNQPSRDFELRQRTFPQVLQAEGYATAFVGKWHIPNPGGGPRSGFDHWVSFEGQGSYFDQTLNVDGEEVETLGFSSDVLTEHACRWIRAEREAPFALILSLKNCHLPYIPPARHRGALGEAELSLPDSFFDPVESLPRAYQVSWHNNRNRGAHANPHLYLQSLRSYWELVMSIDESLGRVLEALEETSQLDRTLVVALSDNGYLVGEHGLTQKQAAYEPSTRIPLLMRLPGTLPEGARVSELALNVDLARTFLEVSGAPAPPGMGGRSLLGLFGEEPGWRRSFLYVAPYQPGRGDRHLAVRTDRWKYLRFRGQRIEEHLFDLKTDPEERRDLAAQPKRQKILLGLRGEMQRLMRLEGVPAEWFDPVGD